MHSNALCARVSALPQTSLCFGCLSPPLYWTLSCWGGILHKVIEDQSFATPIGMAPQERVQFVTYTVNIGLELTPGPCQGASGATVSVAKLLVTTALKQTGELEAALESQDR